MRTVQETEKWLMSLCNQNMTEPHEALINPAELSEQDVHYLYYTIFNNDILYQVALNRDHYTNQVFFSWFFQLADRLAVADVHNAFAKKAQYRGNVLQLLFMNNDAQNVGLWMAWTARLLNESKANPKDLFKLLRERGYYELGNGVNSSYFMSYLIYQQRALFSTLMNWMNLLFTSRQPLVTDALIHVLREGTGDWLINDIINLRDQQYLKEYLSFIQNLFAGELVDPVYLLTMIYRINEPKHYTKGLSRFSPNVKQNYENLVGDLLFASLQNGDQLRMRFDALCNDQTVEPIKLLGATLSDVELRRLFLKFIDKLPQNERQDAFDMALDKSHPFGKFMLQKSWFSSAKDKAFENKITLMSRWSTQSIKRGAVPGGRTNHAVLFQPEVPQAHVPDRQHVAMRNKRS
jgi:hypothetical protein